VHVVFIGTRGVPASYSGFETCVEQVGRRMVEQGHTVTVFCRSGHDAKRQAIYLGMHLRYLPAVREKHLETLSHSALCALRLPRDCAVICMGVGNAPVVRMLEASGRRTVFNVDGADWQREKWGRFARWYLRTCETIAARSRSIVVSDAETVKAYYRDTYQRDTELVVYGADPPTDHGTEALEKFGLESRRYLLFVGRLVPENAPHDFLQGVRLAQISEPAVVVGDASYADDYKARLRADAPPNAVFTGYQFGPAYQQLSSHAGVFVLAATVGGTHPVLVEQMAAGNAILARDNASNREVLGEAGFYWRSPEELATLLRSEWGNADRINKLGDCARRRAEDRYSWDRVTSRYLELCQRVVR
jgi:glycosyltransferase involved in cell wall biosynthesis